MGKIRKQIPPTFTYSQDICFCAEEKCPIREYCFRAIGCRSKIYTASYLGTECNHSNVYKMFLQADHRTISEYRYKQEQKGDKKC